MNKDQTKGRIEEAKGTVKQVTGKILRKAAKKSTELCSRVQTG